MGMHVHKLVKKDGTMVFRLWSSVCGEYATGNLNRDQLKSELLMEYLFQSLINVRDDRLDRYIRNADIVERWPRKSKPNKDDNPSQDDDDFTDVWKLDEELARVALKAINERLAELRK